MMLDQIRLSKLELFPVVIDIETTGLNSLKDRIVAIGVHRSGEDPRVFMDANEREILLDFIEFLLEYPLNSQIIAGYNIQNFDLPFITARAVKHGLTIDAIFLRKMYRVDLMTIAYYFITGSMKRPSLRDFSEFFGIQTDDNLLGSDIPKLWEKKDLEAIKKHCLSDLKLTVGILERLLPLVEYNVEQRYELESVKLVWR